MGPRAKHQYTFGNFCLDVINKSLLRDGRKVQVGAQAFKVLRVLIENHGNLVERQKLLDEAWGDTQVEPGNVDHQISHLRDVLGDEDEERKYIETVRTLGYKFVAEVEEESESDERTQIIAFIDKLHQEYLAFGTKQSGRPDTKQSGILNPDQIYIELECVTPDGKVRNALEWIEEGIKENAGQLLLANFGMGKSFLTVRLMSHLIKQFDRDEHGRIPLRFPLKDFTIDVNQPRAILTGLHKYASGHGFVSHDDREFEQLVANGRFLVILDGIDEYPLLLNYIATDPVEGPIKVLESLDLNRSGNSLSSCPWIATSRSGTFLQVQTKRLEGKYRVARLLEWRYEDQWAQYVQDCHEKLRYFEPKPDQYPSAKSTSNNRDQFIQSVDQRENLKKLTNTPLFARMLIESWGRIVEGSGDLIADDIDLYREYTDDVLSERQVGGLHPDLEMRKRCLESLAFYLSKTNQSYCSVEDLKNAAKQDNQEDGFFRISSFVEQLKTYSLLKCDSTNSLYFSHTSFLEYFLALALLRQVRQAGSWKNTTILTVRRFDSGKLTFLGRMLTKPDYAMLREDLMHTLLKDNHSLGPDFQRNVLEVMLAGGFSLAGAQLSKIDVTGLDFRECDLRNARLHGVTAPGCDFTDANLSEGASLIRADLDSCNFTRANLRGAILRNATLTNIHVYHTDFADDLPCVYGANLKGLHISKEDCDYLSEAVKHDCLRMARESGAYDEQWCENALNDLQVANIV